jgi:hypothetical protein
MGKLVQLAPHGFDHLRMPVPGVDHADSPTKVDEPVAVDIRDHGTFRMRHGYRGDGRHSARDRARAALQQGPAPGAGDFGLEMNHARHSGSGLD